MNTDEKIKSWEQQAENITKNLERLDTYLRKISVLTDRLRQRQIQRHKMLKHLRNKIEEAKKGVTHDANAVNNNDSN